MHAYLKTMLRLLMAILFLVVLERISTAQNFVLNGDFENNLTDWEWFGFEPNIAQTSTDTPSGEGMSAELDIVEALGLPWLVQDVDISTVAEGETLRLTASVREVRQFQPDFDAWIAAQVYMLETSESGAILASGFAFYTNPEWEEQSFELMKPANANIARILFTPQNPDFGVGTGQYRIDDVSLTVAAATLDGDYNDDGMVNAADYTVWRNNLNGNLTLPGEDPNAATPGVVDQEDYLYWRNQYGAVPGTGGASAALAAPEPSSLVVLLICFGLAASRRNF